MAKDDYFVIAYRILDYLYQCFKQGVQPDMSRISPVVLGIEYLQWQEIILELEGKGYIVADEGVQLDVMSRRLRIFSLKIRQKGIEFLMDNRERFPKRVEEPKSDIVYLDFDEQKILRKILRKIGMGKEFPEKVTRVHTEPAACPTCHAVIGWMESTSPLYETKAVKYCPYCGQRISWLDNITE